MQAAFAEPDGHGDILRDTVSSDAVVLAESCGIIIGEQGAAAIQTVGAGGHCFHYRTLVHETEVPQDAQAYEEEEDCACEI